LFSNTWAHVFFLRLRFDVPLFEFLPPKILPTYPPPKPPKPPECPCRKGFFAGTLLGTLREKVALKSPLCDCDLGTLGTVGRSKVANISPAPLDWARFDRPVLLAVALVEAVSQLGEWGKLDPALIAGLPTAASPVIFQRRDDDL